MSYDIRAAPDSRNYDSIAPERSRQRAQNFVMGGTNHCSHALCRCVLISPILLDQVSCIKSSPGKVKCIVALVLKVRPAMLGSRWQLLGPRALAVYSMTAIGLVADQASAQYCDERFYPCRAE